MPYAMNSQGDKSPKSPTIEATIEGPPGSVYGCPPQAWKTLRKHRAQHLCVLVVLREFLQL